MRQGSWKKLSGSQISAVEDVLVTALPLLLVAGPNSCNTVGQCENTRNVIPPIDANYFCVQV